jgi:hypothetical protein
VHTIIVRTLSREYRIRTKSDELARELSILSAQPEMAGKSLQPYEVNIETFNGRHRAVAADQTLIEGTSVEVLSQLNLLIVTGVENEAPGAPVAHGASVVEENRRVLIFAMSGSGKSTLMLHLLSKGMAVEGDEHVVVLEQGVIVRPRPMYIKSGSLQVLPHCAEKVEQCPSRCEGGEIIYSVAPSVFGRPWRIEAGRADHLVFADPNHGWSSTLSPLPRDEAFQRLVRDCFLPETGQSGAIARLRRLSLEAQCWHLRLGNLSEAEHLICHILTEI